MHVAPMTAARLVIGKTIAASLIAVKQSQRSGRDAVKKSKNNGQSDRLCPLFLATNWMLHMSTYGFYLLNSFSNASRWGFFTWITGRMVWAICSPSSIDLASPRERSVPTATAPVRPLPPTQWKPTFLPLL